MEDGIYYSEQLECYALIINNEKVAISIDRQDCVDEAKERGLNFT